MMFHFHIRGERLTAGKLVCFVLAPSSRGQYIYPYVLHRPCVKQLVPCDSEEVLLTDVLGDGVGCLPTQTIHGCRVCDYRRQAT